MRKVTLFFLAALACAQQQPKPQYRVYAIRYATLAGFPVSGLVAGAESSRKMDIAMMVWLIQGENRNILVDSGFYRDHFLMTTG